MDRERRRSRSGSRRQDDHERSNESYEFETSSLEARGQVKRSQSGRMVSTEKMDSSYSYSRADMKPRALSFRISPAKHIATLEHQAVFSQLGTQKSAKYSETHFHASEHISRDGDRSSLPPPIPARRGRQQRTSEPVLFPTMPDMSGMDTLYSTEYTEVRILIREYKLIQCTCFLSSLICLVYKNIHQSQNVGT